MYKKGMIELGENMDCKTENFDTVYGAFLPHSCEAWVIGGPQQIQDLIEDLQKALVVLKKK